MMKLKERKKIVEILNNPNISQSKHLRQKSSHISQPIEQLIFNRSLGRVYGYERPLTQSNLRRKNNLKQLEQTQSFDFKQEYQQYLKRDYSTKSNAERQSPDRKEKINKRCYTTTNRFFIFSSSQNKKQQNTFYRVVENQNDSQKQKYQMLHLNFIKTQKQYQNMYGIPISEFLLEHKFLTLIHQQLLIILLQIFQIDCTNIYEVVTFKQYKNFKQIIVWKDCSIIELVEKISQMFYGATGGDLLNTIHLISQIQPFKYNGKQKEKRNMQIYSKLVYEIENKCIENVLQQGNLNINIEIEKFKNLFFNQQIDINTFINLLTGQL